MSKQPVRSRLMDRLLEEYCLPPLPNADFVVTESLVQQHTRKIRASLVGATVIEATNVARFFDESYIKPSVTDVLAADAFMTDLKCVAPPHAKVFIEWEQPLVPALRMGVLFVAATPDTINDTLRSLVAGEIGGRLDTATVIEGTRWIYLTLSFLEFAANPDHISSLRGPYHVGCAAVGGDGALLSFNPIGNSSLARALPGDEQALIGVSSLVAWTTLAMMNCENIDTVPAAPPSAAFQKARAARGKKPLVSYHTVRVNMAKTPRSIAPVALDGDGDGTTRLHTKRGHMKDYRKGKGLFGRYKGLWYWGPQLAGSGSEGVVLSDYKMGAES